VIARLLRSIEPEQRRRFIPTAARYLARLGEVQVLEGSWNPNMIVIVEFPNLEQARAWYRSPEYAFALEVRDTALSRNLILVDGLNQSAADEYDSGI
jgi:uncharacterized protein (DUF1330 family)